MAGGDAGGDTDPGVGVLDAVGDEEGPGVVDEVGDEEGLGVGPELPTGPAPPPAHVDPKGQGTQCVDKEDPSGQYCVTEQVQGPEHRSFF